MGMDKNEINNMLELIKKQRDHKIIYEKDYKILHDLIEKYDEFIFEKWLMKIPSEIGRN
jgi:hypothetical protein